MMKVLLEHPRTERRRNGARARAAIRIDPLHYTDPVLVKDKLAPFGPLPVPCRPGRPGFPLIIVVAFPALGSFRVVRVVPVLVAFPVFRVVRVFLVVRRIRVVRRLTTGRRSPRVPMGGSVSTVPMWSASGSPAGR